MELWGCYWNSPNAKLCRLHQEVKLLTEAAEYQPLGKMRIFIKLFLKKRYSLAIYFGRKNCSPSKNEAFSLPLTITSSRQGKKKAYLEMKLVLLLSAAILLYFNEREFLLPVLAARYREVWATISIWWRANTMCFTGVHTSHTDPALWRTQRYSIVIAQASPSWEYVKQYIFYVKYMTSDIRCALRLTTIEAFILLCCRGYLRCDTLNPFSYLSIL